MTIYISTLVDIEDISRAYDLGCYDYLKKPFHLKELSLRLDRIKLANTTLRSRTLYFNETPISNRRFISTK